MRNRSDRQIISIMREQYESRIYTTLIESELKGKHIKLANNLEVTRKRDGLDGEKNEKYTIHSVYEEDGRVYVKLIPPPKTAAAGAAMSLQDPKDFPTYDLDTFNANFEV